MLLFVSIAILVVGTCSSAMPIQTRPNFEGSLTNTGEHITDVIPDEDFLQEDNLLYEIDGPGYYGYAFTGQRKKRGLTFLGKLAQEGLRAAKSLLTGAVQTPYRSAEVREFQKVGNVRTALKDFYSVNPKYVQKIQLPNGVTGRVGEVGDRSIVYKTGGKTGRPTIEIIKKQTVGDYAVPLKDRISYANN